MKLAVYNIALNEEANAEAFMTNCKDADLVVIGDGGSTDRTTQIIQDMGGKIVPIRVLPWRFDVPRNTILSVMPPDIDWCMSLDLDERMQPDWRAKVESSWKPGEHDRMKFRYIHNFKPDGSPGTVGMKDFAHTRHNYLWRHAVHENVYYTGAGSERFLTLIDFVVEHRQDTSKTRSYLPLLELECNSPTSTPRHVFWLLREYLYTEAWEKVLEWGERFLAAPNTWYVEQAHTLRYMAKALSNLKKNDEALVHHFRAIERAPREREVWMDLGWYHHGHQQWAQTYGAVTQCLSITARPEHYLAGEEAWGYKPHDLAALSAYKMGLRDKAKEHIRTAIGIAPTVGHLRRSAINMGFKDL